MTSLVLEWDKPLSDGCLPILSYTIQKDGVDYASSIASTATSFTDDISTGGQIGQKIKYRIKAININGESPYSELLTVTVGKVPNAPVALAVRQIFSATSMQMTWNDGAAITDNPATLSFRIYLDDGSGNPPAKAFDSQNQAMTNIATLKNLVAGNSYKVTATAVNSIGESLNSAPLTIYAGTVPSKIKTLVWDDSTTTSIKVRWEAPQSNGQLSLLSFVVYIDEGRTGTPSKTVQLTDTFLRTYTATGLTTGQLVDFQISSTNFNGESELSDVLTLYVAAKPSAPAAPTESAIFNDDQDSNLMSITVAWTEPMDNGAPITGYKLYMAEMSQAFSLVYDGTNRADITSFTVVNGVKKTLNYHFKVIAINAVGSSDISPELTSFIAIVPTAPTDFKFTQSQASTISLEWKPPIFDGGASLTGYYIYFKIAGQLTWSKTALIAEDLFANTLTGLSADTNYAMKMVAVNSKGES